LVVVGIGCCKDGDVYNRGLYVAEKRDALVRWGDHVEALVTNGHRKVVPIKRA
jgi:hypothetical protein